MGCERLSTKGSGTGAVNDTIAEPVASAVVCRQVEVLGHLQHAADTPLDRQFGGTPADMLLQRSDEL